MTEFSNAPAVDRLLHLFRTHVRDYHFYLRDMRNGWVLELGRRREFPIGSCFKLAVFIAAFETLSAQEMQTSVKILPNQIATGGGILNRFAPLDDCSYLQLIQFMLGASDGTATDILIGRVGLDAVDAVVKRYASRSYLSANLNDMVVGFSNLPDASICKQREWRDEDLARFTDEACAFGATDAEDLSQLVLTAWQYRPRPELKAFYDRCLKRRGRMFPRTASYSPFPMFTKSGSLGRCFFLNDCGVVLDQSGEVPLASFAYCANGGRLPALMMEGLGGQIGLEILNALGLPFSPLPDWTETGAQLLMNDHAE